MKQIILPSSILEFTRLVIDDFMNENSLAQKGNWVLQYRRSLRNLKFFQPLTTRHKTKKSSHKKNICGWGEDYMPWKI